MTETEKYVRRYLKEALRQVRTSRIAGVRNGLDIFEKAMIYHYTGDGYISVNRSLRQRRGNKAATLLASAIGKLPHWQGLVYRTARLTKKQISAYKKGLKTGAPIVEPAFISTSRSDIRVRGYPHWNAYFQIFSKQGKSIEECSCFGSLVSPNEEEVLIPPGRSFEVLDVNDSDSAVLIILKEL